MLGLIDFRVLQVCIEVAGGGCRELQGDHRQWWCPVSVNTCQPLAVCACADALGDEPSACVGELRLEHVSFRYPARPDVMVMKDFCLEVKAGRFV